MNRREWFFAILIILLIATAMLTGCGSFLPCTYHGKAVSQRDANHMKALGMSVVCPGDDND